MEETIINISNINKFKSQINSLLENCWDFSKTCKANFDRGFIGELLVLKVAIDSFNEEIDKNKDVYIQFLGSSRKNADIILHFNGQEIKINAKSTNEKDENGKPKWVRQHASKFIDMDSYSLKTSSDKNFYYAYVNILEWKKNKNVEIYLIDEPVAIKLLGSAYLKEYPNKGSRPSGSDDMHVCWAHIKDYADYNFNKLKLSITK